MVEVQTCVMNELALPHLSPRQAGGIAVEVGGVILVVTRDFANPFANRLITTH